jgi:hypothetical protein
MLFSVSDISVDADCVQNMGDLGSIGSSSGIREPSGLDRFRGTGDMHDGRRKPTRAGNAGAGDRQVDIDGAAAALYQEQRRSVVPMDVSARLREQLSVGTLVRVKVPSAG